MSWEIVKLGDCCVKIGSGATPKGGATVYIESGTSLIRSQNVYNLVFDYQGLTHITEDAAKKLNGVAVQEKDVLLNITGDSVARVCMVPNNVLPARVNQHVAIIRTKENLAPEYLLYYLASPNMQAYMLNLAVGKGASRNALTKGMIEEFPLVLPSVEEQKTIVKFLSAYDNLIENNQKQIKLLEEAAQRLYKEWFVELRFPGHENTPIIDGVPKGWEVLEIGDVFKILLGGTPSREKSEYWENGTIPWINSGKVNELRVVQPSEYITDIALNKSATKLLPKHTTLVAITGATLGQVSYTEIETCANQSVVGIVDEKQIHSEYIYCYISDNIKKLIGKATGGAQQHINKDIVNNFPFMVPSMEITKLFKHNVEPLFNKISSLLFMNIGLEEARDRLLPKLMSGELEV